MDTISKFPLFSHFPARVTMFQITGDSGELLFPDMGTNSPLHLFLFSIWNADVMAGAAAILPPWGSNCENINYSIDIIEPLI